MYKLKCWELQDRRTGRTNIVRGKSRRTLEKRLGETADHVLTRQVPCRRK